MEDGRRILVQLEGAAIQGYKAAVQREKVVQQEEAAVQW